MIRHMFFWNFAPGVEDHGAVIAATQEIFRELVEQIDGFTYVQVEADLGLGTHDVVMYSEFDSLEALKAYKVHPLHLACKEKLRDWFTDRVCADLELP